VNSEVPKFPFAIPAPSSGALAFIWAKVSNVPSKRDDPTFKLEVGKAKATSHTATLVRPKTEGEFYEMIHYFIIVIVALGFSFSCRRSLRGRSHSCRR
jgi:hypothetical protein